MLADVPFFWWLFAAMAIFAACGFAYLFLRGERVGVLECPCRVRTDMLSTRLTIARESGGAGAPTVQVRVRVPMLFFMHRIRSAEAKELAKLLDAAAMRLREP